MPSQQQQQPHQNPHQLLLQVPQAPSAALSSSPPSALSPIPTGDSTRSEKEPPKPVTLDMDFSFAIQYAHNIKGENKVEVAVQRRKRYKHRPVKGFKTLAKAYIDMSQILQSPQPSLELSLVSKASGEPVARVELSGVSCLPVAAPEDQESEADTNTSLSDHEEISGGSDEEGDVRHMAHVQAHPTKDVAAAGAASGTGGTGKGVALSKRKMAAALAHLLRRINTKGSKASKAKRASVPGTTAGPEGEGEGDGDGDGDGAHVSDKEEMEDYDEIELLEALRYGDGSVSFYSESGSDSEEDEAIRGSMEPHLRPFYTSPEPLTNTLDAHRFDSPAIGSAFDAAGERGDTPPSPDATQAHDLRALSSSSSNSALPVRVASSSGLASSDRRASLTGMLTGLLPSPGKKRKDSRDKIVPPSPSDHLVPPHDAYMHGGSGSAKGSSTAIVGHAASGAAQFASATTSSSPVALAATTTTGASAASSAAASSGSGKGHVSGLGDLPGFGVQMERAIPPDQLPAILLLVDDASARRVALAMMRFKNEEDFVESDAMICTKGSKDVAAVLSALLARVQLPQKTEGEVPTCHIAIIGDNAFMQSVLRSYVDILSKQSSTLSGSVSTFTSPFTGSNISQAGLTDSMSSAHFPLIFHVVPLAEEHDLANHISSADGIYRNTFLSQEWRNAISRCDGEPASARVVFERISEYISSAQRIAQYELGEAMITCEKLDENGTFQKFLPFINSIRMGTLSDQAAQGHDGDKYEDVQLEYWVPPTIVNKQKDEEKMSIKSSFKYFLVARVTDQTGGMKGEPAGFSLFAVMKEKKSAKLNMKLLSKRDSLKKTKSIMENYISKLICSSTDKKVSLSVMVDGVRWDGVKFFSISPQWPKYIKHFPVAVFTGGFATVDIPTFPESHASVIV